MADIPIIFSGPMARALLDGRKTMTRRLLYTKRKARNGIIPASVTVHRDYPPPRGLLPIGQYWTLSGWQNVKPGDRLWVRETLHSDLMVNFLTGERTTNAVVAYYTADNTEACNADGFNLAWVWKGKSLSSIHMPRWASRLTLVVTATKIERLHSISEADVIAEGLRKLSKDADGKRARGQPPTWKFGLPEADGLPGAAGWPWHEWRISPQDAYAKLWTELHGADAWYADPEVVAISFAVHQANIDAMKEAA